MLAQNSALHSGRGLSMYSSAFLPIAQSGMQQHEPLPSEAAAPSAAIVETQTAVINQGGNAWRQQLLAKLDQVKNTEPRGRLAAALGRAPMFRTYYNEVKPEVRSLLTSGQLQQFRHGAMTSGEDRRNALKFVRNQLLKTHPRAKPYRSLGNTYAHIKLRRDSDLLYIATAGGGIFPSANTDLGGHVIRFAGKQTCWQPDALGEAEKQMLEQEHPALLLKDDSGMIDGGAFGNIMIACPVSEEEGPSFMSIKVIDLTGDRVAQELGHSRTFPGDEARAAWNWKNESEIAKLLPCDSPYFSEMHWTAKFVTFAFLGMTLESLGNLRSVLENIRDYCGSDAKLGEELVYATTKGMLEAVAHLHRLGIFHRDLKLENLMPSRLGFIRIYDFGAATTTNTYEKIPGTDSFPGALLYRQPEHPEMNAMTADAFSAGVILEEFANLQPAKHCAAGYDDTEKLNGDTLSEVAHMMLNKSPKARLIVESALQTPHFRRPAMPCDEYASHIQGMALKRKMRTLAHREAPAS
jgi:serine/threonine protein kinase